MTNQEIARLYFREIEKIHELDIDASQRFLRVYIFINSFYTELTKRENMHFNNVFERISFIFHKYKLPEPLRVRIQRVRRIAQIVNQVQYAPTAYAQALQNWRTISGKEQTSEIVITEQDYSATYVCALQAVASVYGVALPVHIEEESTAVSVPPTALHDMPQFEEMMRAYVVGIDKACSELVAYRDDTEQASEIRISYRHDLTSDALLRSVRLLEKYWASTASVTLLNVQIKTGAKYYPEMIVLDPDYLVDVTSVAECYTNQAHEPMLYLLKKILPTRTSNAMMLGNVVNFLLDELLYNIHASFDAIFPKAFHLAPLQFALLTDEELKKEIWEPAKVQFDILRNTIIKDFERANIHIERCQLEPSYFSDQYGIQGRLDLCYHDAHTDKYSIVELKSGQIFQPNQHGLNRSHYAQVVMYNLLLRSVYKTDAATYILYPKGYPSTLRFAPSHPNFEYEAMDVRNRMRALDQQLLAANSPNADCILDKLSVQQIPEVPKYLHNDLDEFHKIWVERTHHYPIERKYFLAFIGFIAREHKLAKTGVQESESSNGQAALWLQSAAEKEEQFEILAHLQLETNDADQPKPRMLFRKTERTNPLANFRIGDIAVLYPSDTPAQTALNSQIFKGSISDITPQHIEFELRNKQKKVLFSANTHWTIEHDMMDNNFTRLYQNMYAWLRAPLPSRQLLLAQRAPHKPTSQDPLILPTHLTPQQRNVLSKALNATEYFLLVGPPGTGKTKFMLAEMVRYLLNNTHENLLLLAYTNRAVDEICEAIHHFASQHYLRIGSSLNTHPLYENNLLSTQLQHISKRAQVVQLIQSRRIIVATVSALMGRTEIFQLKQFHRAIIDEASQLLEPMLVGILPKVPCFVLIGDHKQLPAVVTQPKETSQISDPELNQLGLTNCRNALFERLYHQAVSNQWHWAYDMLHQQGRMHAQIMQYPAQQFYNNQLHTLTPPTDTEHWQHQPLHLQLPATPSATLQALTTQRFLFVPTLPDLHNQLGKTNQYEASIVAQMVHYFHQIYHTNQLEITPETIGIITPYRAQIASIRQALSVYQQGYEALVTTDTVERYQGGARDIIIVSLCANTERQLDSLVSLSDDQLTDRKLNVALTRARKHLILVGAPSILQQHPIYHNLLQYLHHQRAILHLPN